jgi:5-methylcytosine-specific restriction endonuclease McrA
MTDEERRTRSRERSRKWRAEHPGYHAEAMRKWRKDNPAKIKEINEKQLARIHANPALDAHTKEQKRAYFESHREQSRESGRAWQKRNRAHGRRKGREWYRKHREEYLAHLRRKRAKWRAEHREEHKARARRTYQRNALVHRAKSARRRKRVAGAAGHHTIEQWMARVAYYGWRCRWCRKELTLATLTMDHVIPIAKGGTDWASNLVPACGSCNSRKYTNRNYRPKTILG